MKKRTAGRAKSTTKRVKFTTTLPQVTIDWLRVMAMGNASQAIQNLVQQELEEHPLWYQDPAAPEKKPK